jgi:hypothetical protein
MLLAELGISHDRRRDRALASRLYAEPLEHLTMDEATERVHELTGNLNREDAKAVFLRAQDMHREMGEAMLEAIRLGQRFQ